MQQKLEKWFRFDSFTVKYRPAKFLDHSVHVSSSSS